MSYLESLFSLQEKVAIVTVAKRGNGRAIVEGFLQEGTTVYFNVWDVFRMITENGD